MPRRKLQCNHLNNHLARNNSQIFIQPTPCELKKTLAYDLKKKDITKQMHNLSLNDLTH